MRAARTRHVRSSKVMTGTQGSHYHLRKPHFEAYLSPKGRSGFADSPVFLFKLCFQS